MASPATAPMLDVALLSGFGFSCRPDCGLCCYAEPRVLAEERTRLLQIQPDIEFVRHGEYQFLVSRGDGGSCELLRDHRCDAHSARPHPCREFPVMVHVGTRLQATVVLSCPGTDLAGLRAPGGAGRSGPSAFELELGSVRERLDVTLARRVEASRRRRLRIARRLESEGRWEEEERVRDALRGSIPLPRDQDFPAVDPPEADDGIERLPLFFDGRPGPVALSSGVGGWELHELSPNGGFSRSLGVVPAPDRLPALTPEAAELLLGYLGYWLERDAFFGALHLDMLEDGEGTVTEWAADELRSVGALTLARAAVRAKVARGEVERLTESDVADGIRATDQDLLDRDSWGERL